MRKSLKKALKDNFRRIRESISKLTREKSLEEETQDLDYEMLEKISKQIRRYGLEALALITLETAKPLTFLGARYVRSYLAPFFSLFGVTEEQLEVFEDRRNIEHLIQLIEKEIEKK